MSPEMMQMMSQMDFSQDKVQAQFSELGLKPEDVIQKVLATPDLAAGFSNPKVQQAIFDISQNPMVSEAGRGTRARGCWGVGVPTVSCALGLFLCGVSSRGGEVWSSASQGLCGVRFVSCAAEWTVHVCVYQAHGQLCRSALLLFYGLPVEPSRVALLKKV